MAKGVTGPPSGAPAASPAPPAAQQPTQTGLLAGGAITASPRSRRRPGSTTRRLSLNLRSVDDKRLTLIAERMDGSENEVLRRSLEVMQQLQELADDGGTVYLQQPDGTVVRIKLPLAPGEEDD
jgi:hypothetical protein